MKSVVVVVAADFAVVVKSVVVVVAVVAFAVVIKSVKKSNLILY